MDHDGNQAGKFMEAPNGLEPLHKGFADLPLSHLGTAPRIKSKYSIRYAAIVQACHAFREKECSTPNLLRRSGVLVPEFLRNSEGCGCDGRLLYRRRRRGRDGTKQVVQEPQQLYCFSKT